MKDCTRRIDRKKKKNRRDNDIDLHLHTTQYRAEETNHTQVLDNIDRFNSQFLKYRRYREQNGTAETKHVAN